MNTLLSGFLTDPRKKITRAINEISANEDREGNSLVRGNQPGRYPVCNEKQQKGMMP